MTVLTLKRNTIKMAEYTFYNASAVNDEGHGEYHGQVSPSRPRPNTFKRTATGTAIPARNSNRVQLDIDFAKVAEMEEQLAAGTYYTFDFEG